MKEAGEGAWVAQPDGLYFSGGVNFDNVVRLEREAKLWLENQSQETCILDFSRMERCNSAGVVLLLGLFRAAHKHHKKLTPRNPSENLLSLMRLSSLDEFLVGTA